MSKKSSVRYALTAEKNGMAFRHAVFDKRLEKMDQLNL